MHALKNCHDRVVSALAYMRANPDFIRSKREVMSVEEATEDTWNNYRDNVLPVLFSKEITMLAGRTGTFTLGELQRRLYSSHYQISTEYVFESLESLEVLIRGQMEGWRSLA